MDLCNTTLKNTLCDIQQVSPSSEAFNLVYEDEGEMFDFDQVSSRHASERGETNLRRFTWKWLNQSQNLALTVLIVPNDYLNCAESFDCTDCFHCTDCLHCAD